MINIEKKLIAFVEKNIVVLTMVLLTALAFLIRRQGIWYHSQDYISYFDMHEGNVQSAAYYLVVWLMGYGFDIPMHGIKWLAGIADFAVACLCVLLVKLEFAKQNPLSTYEKVKILLLYAGCLFAPVIYIRGCIWAQVDAVAYAFLLGALCLSKSKRRAAVIDAALLAGIGVALYPCAIVAVVAYFCCGKRYLEKKSYVTLAAIVVNAVVVSGLCGILNSMTLEQSMQSMFNWITYHPYTGEEYTTVVEWLWQMLLSSGYGIALISGIAAFRKKIPYAIAVVIQVIIVIFYGNVLGW